VQVEHRYAVDPGDLFAVLIDPAFLAARSERYGGVGPPTVSRTSSAVQVRGVRLLPLEQVPSPFRRFVGDGRVVQVDTWAAPQGSRVTGSWTLDTGRAPITLRGRHDVDADANGSRYVVTAEVRVSVPVVAGRLTQQVERYLSQLIAAEQAFLADWLTGMMGGREGRDHD
jgi:hypothetical protein